MLNGKKVVVKSCGGGVRVLVVWAKKDSRPEEKAKEPRGRAESERRRRKCVDGLKNWLISSAGAGCE
jgi:hypothetical protein